MKDGWVPGKTLFDIDEAVRRGTIVILLVSDAAQRSIWPVVKRNLQPGAALCFSHGFSIAYGKQTGVVPPKNVDVILVAPKGSGTSVRRNFLTGAGINSSFAVEQNLQTMAGAKTLTLDTKTNHILTMAAEYGPAPSTPPPATGSQPPGRGNRGPMIPDSFSIIVVGK